MSGSPFAGLPRHSAGVVLADPAWSFVAYSPKGWRKSAHAHYPCMDLAEIQAMPVADLAGPGSVLVLWSTQVHLPHAIAVLEAWGFTFKTMGAWAGAQPQDGRDVRADRGDVAWALRRTVCPPPARRLAPVAGAHARPQHSRSDTMTPTTHISEDLLDLLSTDEQDDLQSLECWAYANDGERFSTEWGGGPRYLGLRLLDWVALADIAPRLIEICGLQGAIDRWR